MAETNLALQLQVVDPSTDWESVMIAIPDLRMMCGI